ncbi:MAG: c-type cytochrome [Gemmatimonadetes bacterium]|nr:c-type cytochrome [Gemmatimonadota bacterium]
MNAERLARTLVVVAVFLPLVVVMYRAERSGAEGVVEIRARMPDDGGWLPDALNAEVGKPLRLRLTSDDVMHGFAVGRIDGEAIDVKPGVMVETELRFDRPGRYIFYCTRWCGPGHWRMRGTIQVTGDGVPDSSPTPPYLTLGLDLDEPHLAGNVPSRRPSAERGRRLDVMLPPAVLSREYYERHSPEEIWHALRADTSTTGLDTSDVWDLVAGLWERNTTAARLQEGRRLFRANCAACHGESGGGNGVMAAALSDALPVELGRVPRVGSDSLRASRRAGPPATRSRDARVDGGSGLTHSLTQLGHTTIAPADFTDPARMLGARPAVLHGKIVRGGMGTGMPYWGPIFTGDQVWSLVDYLWAFQFDSELLESEGDSDRESSLNSIPPVRAPR